MRRGYAIQPMDLPAVTVVVPTRGRAAYLEVTLDSLCRQRSRAAHELLVVDDGATDATPEVAERFGVRLIRHGERRSLNAARNTGLREARADLIAFVDDDVLVPPGWLDALVEGAARHPDAEAFGGPIRARFEGHAAARLRTRGPADHDARPRRPRTWRRRWSGARTSRCGARRSSGSASSTRASTARHGDEEDWLLRLRRAGGRIVYLAEAGLDHRRERRRLPASARWPAPPTTAAAERARATAAAARRPASRASCACWPAAAGTRSAARVPRA